MLGFKGTELRPVLEEAMANRCSVILVKDHGVYMMSEIGERDAQGAQKILAYAVGCNPDIDAFEDWWNRALTELGGDDFGEYSDLDDPLFTALMESGDDLLVRATNTQLHLEREKPTSDDSTRLL